MNTIVDEERFPLAAKVIDAMEQSVEIPETCQFATPSWLQLMLLEEALNEMLAEFKANGNDSIPFDELVIGESNEESFNKWKLVPGFHVAARMLDEIYSGEW